MTRNQIWITVGAIAAALALGIVVVVAVTGGDGTDEISTSGTRPTLASAPTSSTTAPPATNPPTSAPPATTVPPTVSPTSPPPTVVVVPPSNPPPTNPPPTQPPPTQPPQTNPPQTMPATSAPPGTNPGTSGPPGTTAPPPTTAPAPGDPGITDTEIRIAVIADDDDAVDGVKAWAATVNGRKNGLAGRKIVVNPFVVSGNPTEYAAAVATACKEHFAIVGSRSNGDSNVGELAACGIPDLPARALSSDHRAVKNTYPVVPTAATKQQVGGFKWLLENVQKCCKQYVISSTNPAEAAATQASAQAAITVGFTSAGGTTLAEGAPQASYTPVVQEMKDKEATFGRSDLPFDSTVKLRKEAQAQGFSGVNAWFCLAHCYTPAFLTEGGDAVNGQYVQIGTNPFEEAGSIAAMKRYLANDGPPNQLGLESYAAGLLFETAARQVVNAEGKAGLTRERLLGAVGGIKGFTAGGILGPTDIGAKAPNGCFVLLKVDGGKFTRVAPTEKAQMSCSPENLLTIGP